MRIRYLVKDIYSIHSNGVWYNKGDIAILSDEIAEKLVEQQIAESFSYCLSDEEIERLFKIFNDAVDFEKKVDIIIELLSNEDPELLLEANPAFILENGTTLSFSLLPKTPDEWYYFNANYYELYTKKYKIFYVEDLKNEYKNSFINYPYFRRGREAELEFIKKHIEADNPHGLAYWYKKVIHRKVPADPLKWKAFLSREIKYGFEVLLHAKAVAEYEGFLMESNIKSFKKSGNKDEQQLTIVNLELEELVLELTRLNYFNINDADKVLEWFRGKKPDVSINMNVNANHFISLIADIWDLRPKIIKKKKKFCCSYINESFLFKGKIAELSYIEKVMKPNNENRVSSRDKTIPDIQSFIT